ncbi:MAG: hypothetical protein II700_04165 [Firmicutes bacterium]|nr:hypothetical protein [Bacillota bacterium]MBQ4234076.1 hypothetical protein [Bacillota bacterium]MBQ5437067.1 hypothetical protein [Bacillota bacterium]
MAEALETFFGLIWLLIWIFVISKIFKTVNKARSGYKETSRSGPAASGYYGRPQAPRSAGSVSGSEEPQRLSEIKFQSTGDPAEAASPRQALKTSGSTFGSYTSGSKRAQERAKFKDEKGESYTTLREVLQEDRKNDWMARQRAEEARALKRNFSDLGAMHDASCAADELKRSHKHDYGQDAIDSPEKNAAKSAWRKKGF